MRRALQQFGRWGGLVGAALIWGLLFFGEGVPWTRPVVVIVAGFMAAWTLLSAWQTLREVRASRAELRERRRLYEAARAAHEVELRRPRP